MKSVSSSTVESLAFGCIYMLPHFEHTDRARAPGVRFLAYVLVCTLFKHSKQMCAFIINTFNSLRMGA